jgi:hypothetical protein
MLDPERTINDALRERLVSTAERTRENVMSCIEAAAQVRYTAIPITVRPRVSSREPLLGALLY